MSTVKAGPAMRVAGSSGFMPASSAPKAPCASYTVAAPSSHSWRTRVALSLVICIPRLDIHVLRAARAALLDGLRQIVHDLLRIAEHPHRLVHVEELVVEAGVS